MARRRSYRVPWKQLEQVLSMAEEMSYEISYRNDKAIKRSLDSVRTFIKKNSPKKGS